MHEQRSEQEQDVGLGERQAQRAVLENLLVDRFPWTEQELVLEVGRDRLDTIDAIVSLEGAGLVHRFGEFVFPTRAARRADEIDLSSRNGAGS